MNRDYHAFCGISESELQSVSGRSDVVAATKTSVFIFELKMDRGRDFETVANEALAQIDSNGYADRFLVSGKNLIKAGVVFSSERIFCNSEKVCYNKSRQDL